MPALPVPTSGSAADSATSSTLARNISHGSRSGHGRPDSQQRMSPVGAVLPPLPSRSPTNVFTSPRFQTSVSSSVSPSRSDFRPPDSGAQQTPAGQRRSSPFRHNLALNVPNEWGQDPLFEDISLIDTSQVDDQYISLIADNDWSSPSGYHSITTTNSGTDISQGTHISGPQSSQPNSQRTNHTQATLFSSNEPLTTRPVTQTNTSLSALPPAPVDDDLLDDSSDSLFLDAARATITMPAVTRSRAFQPQAAAPNKRQRKSRWIVQTESTTHPRMDSDDDPFASDLFEEKIEVQPDGTLVDKDATESLKAIDLTETKDIPEEASKSEIDNRVKLGAFQCAICMDNVTSLVVTHCGHLYCAACLHQSLHVASTRGKCPMCRAKVETKPRSSYTSKTKGYWPLELKLMTSVRKGKRKADAMDK